MDPVSQGKGLNQYLVGLKNQRYTITFTALSEKTLFQRALLGKILAMRALKSSKRLLRVRGGRDYPNG